MLLIVSVAIVLVISICFDVAGAGVDTLLSNSIFADGCINNLVSSDTFSCSTVVVVEGIDVDGDVSVGICVGVDVVGTDSVDSDIDAMIGLIAIIGVDDGINTDASCVGAKLLGTEAVGAMSLFRMLEMMMGAEGVVVDFDSVGVAGVGDDLVELTLDNIFACVDAIGVVPNFACIEAVSAGNVNVGVNVGADDVGSDDFDDVFVSEFVCLPARDVKSVFVGEESFLGS